jgi:signal transduction histidine kinase
MKSNKPFFKTVLTVTLLPIFLLFACNEKTQASNNATSTKIAETNVVNIVRQAEHYIQRNGKEKAIIEFRKSAQAIFMGDYQGVFLVSPLHPEMVGTNQFDYKDAAGVLVVQEEINKAKAGGGWLTGRWRPNPQTGQYQCRKIFILPIAGNYFIGSWYHYTPNKPGICLT